MPKQRCSKCGSMMKIVSKGNTDYSTWEKQSKSRNMLGHHYYKKLKAPSRYQVVMKCPNGACRSLMTYSGASRSQVHGHLNRKFNKERCEQITKDAEERKREESLERKRKEQEEERQNA